MQEHPKNKVENIDLNLKSEHSKLDSQEIMQRGVPIHNICKGLKARVS